MVVQTCNPRYLEGSGRILVLVLHRQKLEALSKKKRKEKKKTENKPSQN
jgi:hypothetical protein